ncbi:MAG: fatty acid desaturase [Ignavibacteriales bacterium]|nr:fatty acid desaturase [Ignavibacteriales bacterium]
MISELSVVVKRPSDLYFCPGGDVTKIFGRKDFPAEKKQAIRSLHMLDRRWNWVLALHYGLWLISAWIAIASENIVVGILGYLIGGLSLSTLSVLSHESSHNLFTRNPKIDRWIGFICGIPILFSGLGYRVMHPIHHKRLRSPQDPDDIENVSKDSAILRWVYVLVFFFSVYLYLIMVPVNAVRNGAPKERIGVIAEFAAMVGVITLGWLFIPTAWMVEGWLIPLLVAGQVANIRGIAEHGMTTSGNEMTDTRTVATNPVLSFLMCNINYHIEHHLYPGVPWYNLPKVHKILHEEFETAGSSVYTSYRRFLADVVKALVNGVVSNRRLIPEHIREHVCV